MIFYSSVHNKGNLDQDEEPESEQIMSTISDRVTSKYLGEEKERQTEQKKA